MSFQIPNIHQSHCFDKKVMTKIGKHFSFFENINKINSEFGIDRWIP